MRSTGHINQPGDRPTRGARGPDLARAALEVFRRYGYRRASVDDVAREAGVAKGTVYLYFRSKDALYRAAVEAVLARMLEAAKAAAEGPGGAADRVAAVLQAKHAALEEALAGSPHAADLVSASAVQSKDLVDAFDAKLEALLAGLLREAGRAGELDPEAAGVTAREAAALLLDAAHGLDLSARGGGKRLQALARVFLAGLRPRRG
ncbi:MAG: helix-turn-helix domain-containing protein [Anaeromyxobacter sp.]